ncbi:MAG: type IV pilus twitching motility protein PilT [Armatimonadetes bacterium]|nr:type IV pilus twitching motility protein PilT [Armatimonadota bacterium]
MEDLLRFMIQGNASDLILKADRPPLYRVLGDLMPLGDVLKRVTPPMSAADVVELGYTMLSEEQIKIFEEEWELDLAHELPGVCRFRVNFFKQRGQTGVAIRAIPFEIRTTEQLSLPKAVVDFAERPRGLVLVTGPTGSGKSTTLAALINYINRTRSEHIITIEDPVEFVHEDIESLINQRELHQDTHSFGNSLRSALREDPDVILIGEMRDLETIEMAITSAETGHLVFGTLHTTDAVQTVDRIIDVFPVHQQQQIRLQMASNLIGVVSQTLLKRKDGSSRIAAYEVMVCTNAIRSLIREAKTHQIASQISVGSRWGMRTLNQALSDMVANELVTRPDAIDKSSHPEELRPMIEEAIVEKKRKDDEAAKEAAREAQARRR